MFTPDQSRKIGLAFNSKYFYDLYMNNFEKANKIKNEICDLDLFNRKYSDLSQEAKNALIGSLKELGTSPEKLGL